MVGIARCSAAHQTRLPGDKPQMFFVAIAARLGEQEGALVYALARILLGRTGPNLLHDDHFGRREC